MKFILGLLLLSISSSAYYIEFNTLYDDRGHAIVFNAESFSMPFVKRTDGYLYELRKNGRLHLIDRDIESFLYPYYVKKGNLYWYNDLRSHYVIGHVQMLCEDKVYRGMGQSSMGVYTLKGKKAEFFRMGRPDPLNYDWDCESSTFEH